MVASHIPFRANEDVLASLASDYAPAHGSWQAVHVLASDCACSRAVADHLVQRGTLLQLHESVVLIGDDRGLQGKLVKGRLSCSTDLGGGSGRALSSPQRTVAFLSRA